MIGCIQDLRRTKSHSINRVAILLCVVTRSCLSLERRPMATPSRDTDLECNAGGC
ncbi:hypothetical protein PAXRUDRAFT_452080 [Paxillus rubicundulus Ve08.2h10]|uniref:Uncharacterized protein n=1 Tax=Paxillus rubicundulus Ve08.2h10 TaxID=930991 RepID=A0A0D0DB84_9AGAM|nr:hypothetical protein PAXRUDRAFT_452080 [Paxillus rubicundulus Ve08.2h10]